MAAHRHGTISSRQRFRSFTGTPRPFDLPKGAELLATGSAVPNQAFLLGHALGVQFHPEVTAPVIAQWAKDLDDAERLMLIRETRERIEGNRQLCTALMDAFCAGWSE